MNIFEIDCPTCKCGEKMYPITFTDFELKNGYKTGRKRKAVSHFECMRCGAKETVDDSFDDEWRY